MTKAVWTRVADIILMTKCPITDNCYLDVHGADLRSMYIRVSDNYICHVNGVKPVDIMFSLLCVCAACAHGCSVPHTIHSKLRNSNLTSTSPGTVLT